MSTELNNIANNLFDKIRSRFEDISLGDENAKATSSPESARFFNFDYVVRGESHGNITISIIDERSLKIYFSKNISDNLDDGEQKNWAAFLKELRFFAKRNLLNFEPRDITRSSLKYRDISQTSNNDGTYSKDEVKLDEGLAGTKRSSYEKRGPVKIIVRHSKPVDEERRGARSRNINSIFLETHDGERFKIPQNSLTLARAMARHVSEGGSMSDNLGQHILEMSQEVTKLRPFKSSMKRRTFEDAETQQMVEAAFEYHGVLNNTLKKMSGKRGYNEYKENFKSEQPLMDDYDEQDLKERFVKRTYNDKVDDALPVIHKAYNMKKENKFAQQFESWANSVIDEGNWDAPSSDTEIDRLKEIFSSRLPVGVDGMDAINALSGLIGDDQLFDKLSEIAMENPEEDARRAIADWLKANDFDTFQQLKNGGTKDDSHDSHDSDEEVDEAKGDIRKAIAGAALAGGMAMGGHAVDNNQYSHSPQLQKLEQLHTQAVKSGDSMKAKDLERRIGLQKDRLSMDKGEVNDKSGNPVEVHEAVSDILRLAGLR